MTSCLYCGFSNFTNSDGKFNFSETRFKSIRRLTITVSVANGSGEANGTTP